MFAIQTSLYIPHQKATILKYCLKSNVYWATPPHEQKWFAQCGFETTSVTWLFPGQTVRVEAPCLDCGDPMVIEMRDGEFQRVDPPGIIGHLNYGFGPSRGQNFFL